MRKIIIISIFFVITILFHAAHAAAATYYVDFESGSDSNAGTSTSSPWKHSPGDSNATGNANRSLTGGDTVIFKGGVIYRGEVTIYRKNGSADNPITLKGDGWGTQKAVFDGSTPITSSFTRCQSASDCFGNPNYQNIYYTDLPIGTYTFDTGFYEDDEFLWHSQDPNPADPMYYDRREDLRVIPLNDSSIKYGRTYVTDPRYFTQSDASFWNGAYVIAWVVPNVMSIKKITSYDPGAATVYYNDLGNDTYLDRDSYYSVLNHPSMIDKEGEFSFDEITGRFYVWPRGNTISHSYSVRTMTTGIYINSSKYVVVEGFVVRKYTFGIRAIDSGGGGAPENVIIRNNEVKKLKSNNWYAVQVNGNNIIVENNKINDCQRAVGILGGGSNVVIKDNYVRRATRVGIWFMNALNSSISNNTVLECKGTHANGISVYSNSADITVSGNSVKDSNIAFTLEQSSNLNVYNNIFIGDGITTFVVANWGGMTGTVNFYNNIVLGSSNHYSTYLGTETEAAAIYFRNNIVDGGGWNQNRSNNIYTGLAWNQSASQGWTLGESESVESDLSKIFVDSSGGDYHLKFGSLAIDTGSDLSAYFTDDFAGISRPQGTAWDIGAYEYCASGNCSGSGGNTPPPSSGGSGGDSSASGGSGCGFVKDDGKGQKAKGEGLSFAMMLIIILAGIALVRKVAINKGSKGVEHIKKMICLMSYSKCIWFLIMVIASTALVNTSHAAVLVDENFDDSSYADTGWTAWLQNGNCNTGTTMSINSNAAYHGLAGLDIYYHMGDNPRGDCQLHQDNNTSLVHAFAPGLSHYFVRGYFRFAFDTATLCSQPWVQRKLIYFKPQNYGTGSSFIIVAWPWGNCSTDGYNISLSYGGPNGMGNTLWGDTSQGFLYANNHLQVNTWYYLEAEVEYGAYGQDTMRIWLAPAGTPPSLILERTDLALRSSTDVVDGVTVGTIEIGRQVDISRSSFSQGIDEHRYWDEIVISTTPIGPIDGASGGDTPPPSSSGVGDSGGGSGGSGCGFVKEINGKGQKAKGEGLTFAIMLIIALSGIALRKIITGLKMRRTFSALIKGLCFFVVAVLLAQIAACGSGGVSDSSNSSNSSSGGSGGGTNNGAATINMVLPQNNSVGAALDTYITLQSSAPLNPATVSASTFYVRGPGNSAITATVSYQNQAVTIRPQSALQPLTTYTVTCANGVLDSNGVSLPTSTWSFTTTNAAGNPLPLLSKWESDMVTYGNQWGLFLQNPNNNLDAKLNNVYYDGERTFYQIASYLGQQEPWNSYAQAAETTFRDNYFIPNNYNIPGYYRFPDGLYLDAQRNGDTTSAAGLLLMRDNPAFSNPENNVYASNWYWSQFSREIAYAIGTNILAERAGNARQTQRMQLYVAMALNHLHEWRTQTFGNPDATYHYFQPFMFGLTADALISYYEWEIEQGRTPDATIPNAIKAMADWMWTAPVTDQPGKNMWVPNLGGTAGAWTDTGGSGYGAFRYSDRTYTVSGGGQPNPAPDLNLLIAPAYAWLYKHFGDPAYRDRGDLLWAGGVALASLGYSGKIYNQNYRLSFNYIKWRQEGQAKWGN